MTTGETKLTDRGNWGTEIFNCRICGNSDLESVLDLGVQALTGVFPSSREQAVKQGPLELVRCNDHGHEDACGLVQLRYSYDGADLYGANYGYRSGLNPSMISHLRDKAGAIRSRVELAGGDVVLDIGSNDGTLLRFFIQPGVERLGIDPSGEKFRQYYDPEATLISDFFSARCFREVMSSKKAKVVTSLSMFYDLESPLDFMREVASVLADDGIWVCEQSYLPTMLATNSFDTICHEHIEYYALKQIQFMTRHAGLHLLSVEFNSVNGGSFSFVAGKNPSAIDASVGNAMAAEKNYLLGHPDSYGQFRTRVSQQRDSLREFLSHWSRAGRSLFGYGASTKGNVLLQYCGVSESDLPVIAEVNSDKFGCFTPHTLIPIVDEKWARTQKPDGFLVLPWHFRDFIVSKEKPYLEQGGALVFPLPELSVVKNSLLV